MLNIVLVEPQIPPNTGNIGRLCVNIGARLHLVGPLGFSIDDRSLRRAGLDYWAQLNVVTWESLEEFLSAHPVGEHTHLATTKTDRIYWDATYHDENYLLFGSETKGLDAKLLETHPDRCITIPMTDNGRSLNLSVAVGIVAYEALRQKRRGR